METKNKPMGLGDRDGTVRETQKQSQLWETQRRKEKHLLLNDRTSLSLEASKLDE